jgi:hypothetical protein
MALALAFVLRNGYVIRPKANTGPKTWYHGLCIYRTYLPYLPYLLSYQTYVGGHMKATRRYEDVAIQVTNQASVCPSLDIFGIAHYAGIALWDG